MPRVGGPVGRPGPKPSSDAVEPWAGMKNSLDQLLLYGLCRSCKGGGWPGSTRLYRVAW